MAGVVRARLWRRERADVTDESVAHFTDGLTAGESVADLVAAFGDERQAARLIRRAKIRNRSIFWHLLRFCRRAVGAILLGYAVLTVRFYLGRPTVSVDYLAQLNAPAERTPEAQRAWPLYVKALVELDVLGERLPSSVFELLPGVTGGNDATLAMAASGEVLLSWPI